MRARVIKNVLACTFILMTVTNCKETNSLVKNAKTDYKQAISDSAVAFGAPEALKEAKKQLKIIDNLKKNGAGRELINHHAFIARQNVKKAYDIAALNATQDKIVQAEQERKKLLAEVQEAEAMAAQRRAEEAQRQAEEARQQSQELAQKLSELQAEQTDRGIVLTLKSVLFDFGKATLKPSSEEPIAKLARFLVEYPERVVMIEGFTDNIGSKEANEKLSLQRAEAVKQAIVAHGIAESRVQTRGYGENYAVADNNTETGRQLNRRVEIIVSDERGIITERLRD